MVSNEVVCLARVSFIRILHGVVVSFYNPKSQRYGPKHIVKNGLSRLAGALDGALILGALPPEIPRFSHKDIVGLEKEILAFAKLEMPEAIRERIFGDLTLRGVPGDIIQEVQSQLEELARKSK